MHVGFSGIFTPTQPLNPVTQDKEQVQPRFAGLLDTDALQLTQTLQARQLDEKVRRLHRELNAKLEPHTTGWDVVELIFIIEVERRQAFEKMKADHTKALDEYNEKKWFYNSLNWSEKRRYRKNNGGKEPQKPSGPGRYYSPSYPVKSLMSRGGLKNRTGVESVLKTLKASGYVSLSKDHGGDKKKHKYSYYQLLDNSFAELSKLIKRRPALMDSPPPSKPAVLPEAPITDAPPTPPKGGLLFA